MLGCLLAGVFMAILDVAVANIALPNIGRTLHANGSELQLVTAGYIAVYAMGLITGARLGNILGYKRLFIWGVALFTLFSFAFLVPPL